MMGSWELIFFLFFFFGLLLNLDVVEAFCGSIFLRRVVAEKIWEKKNS